MAVTLRTEKGFPLTYEEMDENFSSLDTRITAIEGISVNSVNDKVGDVTLTTSDISEGTNLYYTNSRFDSRLGTKTTTDIAEGTNLYHTTARVRDSITASTGITYNSTTGQISFSGNSDQVTEGSTNLYHTNARVDTRIAAATLDDISDVDYPSAPNNGEVLTWNSSSGNWEPILPPGAAGGEINTANNLGAGTGIFAAKVGADLRFYSLTTGVGMSITGPTSNVLTISTDQDLRTSGSPSFAGLTISGGQLDVGNTRITSNNLTTTTTNGNIAIAGNGTGYAVVNAGAGLAVTSGDLVAANIVTTAGNSNINITPNGVGQVVIANAVVSTLTSGRITYATTNKTLTDNANLAFDGSVVTVTGNVHATVLKGGNITVSANTITNSVTNANVNISGNGTGDVVINSLAVSDLTSTRIPYASSNGAIIDNANLVFSGTVLTVTGSANATTVNATTVNGGNVRLQSNHIETINTNGNLTIQPNGTGRIGINTASPAYLLSVNGTFGANSVVTTGNITVGNSMVVGTTATSDTITLTARVASSVVPSATATYDLGTNLIKFRNAYFAGDIANDGSMTIGDSSADTLTINALIGSTITPAAGSTYDIGLTGTRWRDLYLSGDISFGGGDIISTAVTANVINATATTVNFAGAATSLTMGSTSAGNLVIQNPTVTYGNGTTAAVPATANIKGTNGSGTNISAANLNIGAGAGTGTGTGGSLVFTYAAAGASGSTVNAYATKMSINTNINVTADILPTANLTYNLGATGSRFNNLWGQSSSALYADLAERYYADAAYDEGTVLVFGGAHEVTVTSVHADTAVAGVVSTKPAYLMNDVMPGDELHPAVALRGKVPVKVIGKVSKGDLLVSSSTAGHGQSVGKIDHGASVFAKSLEDKHDEGAGMITAVIL